MSSVAQTKKSIKFSHVDEDNLPEVRGHEIARSCYDWYMSAADKSYLLFLYLHITAWSRQTLPRTVQTKSSIV